MDNANQFFLFLTGRAVFYFDMAGSTEAHCCDAYKLEGMAHT
jgi:hypothetical protein